MQLQYCFGNDDVVDAVVVVDVVKEVQQLPKLLHVELSDLKLLVDMLQDIKPLPNTSTFYCTTDVIH